LKNLSLKISILVESIVLLNNIEVGVCKRISGAKLCDGKTSEFAVIFLTNLYFRRENFFYIVG
jgi:hypothetical protein